MSLIRESQLVRRRQLVVESYTTWAGLQRLVPDAPPVRLLLSQPVAPATVQLLQRCSRLLRDNIIAFIVAAEQDPALSAAERTFELQLHASLHAVLELGELLYLPSDGYGMGAVGEELIDWLNRADRAPTAQEGQELADLERPWEHPNYWPVVIRCVLRAHLSSAVAHLAPLASHPSSPVRTVAFLAIDLLESFPRTSQFGSAADFAATLRDWKAQTTRAFKTLKDLSGAPRGDGGAECFAALQEILEIMQGSEERVLSCSEDWREALAAWGIWVNPRGGRDDLPEVMARVLKVHSVDQTLPQEAIESALLLGDVARALQQSNQLSTWLVAHLADLLDKVGVIEADPTATVSLRDHFVLAYTDALSVDESLWRIVVDYLDSCGDEGRLRMERVLKGVKLGDKASDDMSESEAAPNVEEVLRICAQYGLSDVANTICQSYSESLIEQRRYGEAVSYCIRAADSKQQIARIADLILDEYVVNGQEAFISHVDSIPTSLLRAGLEDEPVSRPVSPDHQLVSRIAFTSRLSFLARYREFFALYARGERRRAAELLALIFNSGAAPKHFYAVLLLDLVPLLEADELLVTLDEAYDLLRCLEEIVSPIAARKVDLAGNLDSLARIIGSQAGPEGTRQAMKQLEVVRGALASYLARCFCL